MRDDERRALESLRFDFAQVPDDVWRTSPYHVDELHAEVMRDIADGIRDAAASRDASPIGVAVQGHKGVGKTHLLGLVRERVQAAGGYFFLVSPHDGDHFWDTVAQSMIEGLLRQAPDAERQLTAFLRRLASAALVLGGVRDAVLDHAPLTPRDLASFVAALRRLNPRLGLECQDTARALVLLNSSTFELQDIGYHYLSSLDEGGHAERSAWGIRSHAKPPKVVVRELSSLLALTGPSVIAVDQIDALVAQAIKAPNRPDGDGEVGENELMLEQIADGLMTLREITRRTLTVVSCLPDTWILIRDKAVATATDRFRPAATLHRIPNAETGRAIIERRFTERYKEIGFDPPYPTWPVAERAFADAVDFTPRALLQRVDAHVRACLRRGTVTELADLLDSAPESVAAPPEPPESALRALDARFAQLRESADVSGALAPATEDGEMPALLSAALTAWIAEQGDAAGEYAQDGPPGHNPALHARLRRTLDERIDDEAHWAFRAIAQTHPRAVQCRIRNATTKAGLRTGDAKRKLVLLRNTPWPSGPVTAQVLEAFRSAGGLVTTVSEGDLRTFAALRTLLSERDEQLLAWLQSRRPAGRSALLSAVLTDAGAATPPASAPTGPPPAPTAAGEPSASSAAAPRTPSTPAGGSSVPAQPGTTSAPADQPSAARHAPVPAPLDQPPAERKTEPAADPTGRVSPSAGSEPTALLTVGTSPQTGAPVRIALDTLRRHTAVFAGSGSGKTVLIRRLVEECALRGVSAIVLDPNNDLARLGDAWPAPPAGWGPGDDQRAAEYLAHTEVVVWTPRKASGRPLTFQPLPDFRSVLDDPDEFTEAVDSAVAALAPRAKVDGNAPKATQGRAVLKEALTYFARRGGGDLRSFLDLLSELPDGVSGLIKGAQLASDLAETLKAATVTDPLFGGEGTPVDPGLLLRPAPGKRARVSVVNLVGLPSDDQRQSFVNQLQMALFAWVKKHPARDRPLAGLLVMDEAQTLAPSGALTACTRSTLALASQARKYGLGLVFATQAPKGLHNGVSGNAATQFYGLLNAPAQIAAVQEIARAKGATAVDISRLSTGEFYVAAPEVPFQKVRTPLCLSHHPASPLTAEEVIARARPDTGAADTARRR